ncbi:uncharacterized protein [Anabrus simplex]|uniref:uncharacterized protein isoform X1 n=1 Tax=Anabrus simplex TaxID=316456 RepID=UPI0035A27000
MDNSESGDDLGGAYLTVDSQNYMVQEELDDDPDAALTAENTDDSNQGGSDKPSFPLREQDRFLPIANIAKIMKRGIPEPGKIAKDARECVQECVSEFISFITSEASDRCHMEKRKTINGEDILFAMTNLGFDNYVEPLKLYLQKYRELQDVKEITDCFLLHCADDWVSLSIDSSIGNDSPDSFDLVPMIPLSVLKSWQPKQRNLLVNFMRKLLKKLLVLKLWQATS